MTQYRGRSPEDILNTRSICCSSSPRPVKYGERRKLGNSQIFDGSLLSVYGKERLARYKFSLRPLKTLYKFRILTFASANSHTGQIWKVTCKCDAAVCRGRAADVLVGQRSARHRSLPCECRCLVYRIRDYEEFVPSVRIPS